MFDKFFDPATIAAPHEFYRQTRENLPVFESVLQGHARRVFVVTSYDLVRQVMGDNEGFSNDFVEVMMQGAEPNPEADALFEHGIKQISLLLNLDEPDHKRYRALATTVFTPRQAANLAPMIERVMDERGFAVRTFASVSIFQSPEIPRFATARTSFQTSQIAGSP